MLLPHTHKHTGPTRHCDTTACPQLITTQRPLHCQCATPSAHPPIMPHPRPSSAPTTIAPDSPPLSPTRTLPTFPQPHPDLTTHPHHKSLHRIRISTSHTLQPTPIHRTSRHNNQQPTAYLPVDCTLHLQHDTHSPTSRKYKLLHPGQLRQSLLMEEAVPAIWAPAAPRCSCSSCRTGTDTNMASCPAGPAGAPRCPADPLRCCSATPPAPSPAST